jgi:hypothetical protein
MLTALAAKGVESNAPQQPFPEAPAVGPSDVPTLTPWALSSRHDYPPSISPRTTLVASTDALA